MNRSLLVTAMAVMAWGLSSIPVHQSVVHAEGMASDTKAAAQGSTQSLEGLAADTKEAAKGRGKSLTEKVGKVKTDAGKTKDSARALDVMGTTQGASDTKQSATELKDSASE